MKKSLALLVGVVLSAAAALDDEVHYAAPDAYTLIATRHLVDDFEARPAPGLVNVVVEIPAGTSAKWEVEKDDGSLRWEFKKGEPRIVRYLPYPGNYGLIPRTAMPEELGGDGDPMDVIVLGPAVERGALVRARPIGVLKLLDRGEQDDKVLAVQEGTPLGDVNDLAELEERFRGVGAIVETWFSNYKGPGKMESQGLAGRTTADAVIDASIAAYEHEHAKR